MSEIKQKRLESLDILRGFDLFCLVAFQPVFRRLVAAIDHPVTNRIMEQFEHVAWEGFTFWDIIMPLFMFMSGVSIRCACSKYQRDGNKNALYSRIITRVLLLFLFGMICGGNLLALDWNKIYFYSNTLQAIAIGYLISAILFLHFSVKWQVAVISLLLLGYWAVMMFATAGPFGGGNFSPDLNMAEYIDRIVLGRFRDKATLTENGIDFGNYHYTWILSSLNFGVTVMTGTFAGQILKNNVLQDKKKLVYLTVIGASMVLAGWLWGFQMPIIKRIWTSSMTLFSSGICFLLMALSYYWVDYRHKGKHLQWLKIYGMNSILAYMLFMVVNFSCITSYLLRGTEQFLSAYFPTFVRLADASILFFILWVLFREKKFLKV